jgi:hypothetical protein
MHLHGGNQLPFEGLSFQDQARSLNGTVRHTERALEANLRLAHDEGRDPEAVFHIRIALMVRMTERVAQRHGYTIIWP